MSQPSFGAGVSLCGHPHPSLILPLLVAFFLCVLPCYDIPRQNYSWNFPLWMLACHCGHPPMTSAPVVDHASYNLVASRVDLLPSHDVIPKQICSWHFPLWMPPPLPPGSCHASPQDFQQTPTHWREPLDSLLLHVMPLCVRWRSWDIIPCFYFLFIRIQVDFCCTNTLQVKLVYRLKRRTSTCSFAVLHRGAV